MEKDMLFISIFYETILIKFRSNCTIREYHNELKFNFEQTTNWSFA